MTPLIDGDILLHELGWSGQFKDKETGEEIISPFDRVQELLDEKIKHICREVDADQPPIIFLTDSVWLAEQQGRVFIPNFRYKVAVTRPYKDTRNNPKPFHFYNIMVYLLAEYDTRVARKGVEADDAMCIHQTSHDDTIICSRDKDLRICPGWHYTWECGKQRSVGPHFTDEVGQLQLNTKDDVIGYGLKFFFYQMLVGDPADTIPGLPGVGKKKAFALLSPLQTEDELFWAVVEMYKEKMGDEAKTYFREQADLLWMQQTGKLKYKKGT
jgi:hypothetical protein